ncbi:hypothetical protein QBC43DRAFT_307976 [Cladorrhinum sp. PSN259]|nr:hypothetical protein QBC43DRAFT_307976 [Cladorrhinum sp. PSN259]
MNEKLNEIMTEKVAVSATTISQFRAVASSCLTLIKDLRQNIRCAHLSWLLDTERCRLAEIDRIICDPTVSPITEMGDLDVEPPQQPPKIDRDRIAEANLKYLNTLQQVLVVARDDLPCPPVGSPGLEPEIITVGGEAWCTVDAEYFFAILYVLTRTNNFLVSRLPLEYILSLPPPRTDGRRYQDKDVWSRYAAIVIYDRQFKDGESGEGWIGFIKGWAAKAWSYLGHRAENK